MYNFDNLKDALKRYRDTKEAYFALAADASVLAHVEARRSYDDAAHSVAFHADICFGPSQPPAAAAAMDASAHPDFQRLLKSIEQHDSQNDPACSTGQIAFDALMHETFGPQDKESSEVLAGYECRNCGTRYLLDAGAQCPRCAAAPEPDENQDDDSSSSEWTEPATDEDLSWQSSESGDLFDDYDDDEDEWPEQAVSTSIHIGKDGHIKIVEGVLSRYKGEDWGEASGWHQTTVEMDDLTTEAEQKVREWCKDKEPGTYDVPYELIDEIELIEPLDYDDLEDEDDEEEEPVHAILEPFGDGKCHCPYCNAECAPDYCSGCQSTLTPPAIKPEIRTDLPDEPPF